MIGTAKDLVETIAKAAVTVHTGEVEPSNPDLPALLTRAHRAFDRLPGRGAAEMEPLKSVAQGAKSAIAKLPELRNQLGTGHGRLLVAGVEEEDARLCVDLATLWSRWALARLARLLAARPATIVAALDDIGSGFPRGRLRDWLADHLVEALDSANQRLVGAAVAHRAMQGTYTVTEEGVKECADDPDLSVWPAAYRTGLLDGLFLSRNGHIDINSGKVRQAAQIIAPHPQAASVLQELESRIKDATFAYRFEPPEMWQVAQEMRRAVDVLPDGDAQEVWQRISKHIDLD
ncbi:MAG TPA: abortive infection family protein [Galbitalea sp.]|nr:abortive infection family protein [Galbitalea sp.]